MAGSDGVANNCGCARASRRAFVTGIGAAALDLTLADAAKADAASERPKAGDLFVNVEDDSKTPLRADQVKSGDAQILAWPYDPETKTLRDGSRLNKVMLMRIDAGKMNDDTKGRSADGLVAYSAICPHAGCEVTGRVPGSDVAECPCHNSQYDLRDSARVLDGPTPKPLPALALKVVDGMIVAAGAFTARVGFTQT